MTLVLDLKLIALAEHPHYNTLLVLSTLYGQFYNMEKSITLPEDSTVSVGNVYIMTHSFFSDVIKIGCTLNDPEEYTKELSAKSPGTYTLCFSIKCNNPCQVKKQIREYFNADKYTNEFYQVSAEVAKKLLKRETLRIPGLSL